MPRGAAPLPPVRQTGVQICYTMAPEDQDAVRGTVPKRAAEGSHPAARFWRPPWSLDRGPERLAGVAPASPVWKTGALLLS